MNRRTYRRASPRRWSLQSGPRAHAQHPPRPTPLPRAPRSRGGTLSGARGPLGRRSPGRERNTTGYEPFKAIESSHPPQGIQTPMAHGSSTTIISMIQWTRTSRLSMKISLSRSRGLEPREVVGHLGTRFFLRDRQNPVETSGYQWVG